MSEANVFVDDGLTGGRYWATYRRRATGSLQRVKSASLPLRGTREEAELDLRRWLYRRAPVTREHRQHRAAKAASRAQRALRQAKKARNPDQKAALEKDAQWLFQSAWQELVTGAVEPSDPDHQWYPAAVHIPLLAALVGRNVNIEQLTSVLGAYDQFRACRVCGCREQTPCAGGCAWVEWDLCSRCTEERVRVVGS